MFQPVKIAFGDYMARFHGDIVATTKPLIAYKKRPLSKGVAWCSGRMIDAAEDMLASWRKNDTNSAPTKPAELPVILVAMAKDYIPTAREYTRQVAERQLVTIPEDPKERMFGLRYLSADIRAQVAVFAADEPTARSLAAQFCLFIDAMPNRTFSAFHRFAGLDLPWAVQLETSDAPAMTVATDAKNLTIVAVDLTLRTAIPIFDWPADAEPNDGKGTDGNPDDPHGYLLVDIVNTQSPDFNFNRDVM